MKGPKFGIFSSLAALVFLALIRFAWARLMTAAIPAPYDARIISALGVLTVIAFAVLIDRLIRVFYWNGYLRRKRKRETPALVEDILTIALVVLGASIGLFFEAGVSFTGLLTASGATAIVLGIALQAVISDVFSGLSLNFDGSYSIGDWLTVYSDHFPEPVYGQVQGITWRSTFLVLADGPRVMVPNHVMTSNPVMNHSRPPGPKRLSVEVPIDNRFPSERVMSILLAEACRSVREKPFSNVFAPDVLIDRVDSDSVYMRVRFYADPDLVNPAVACSLMSVALHRATLRHSVPTPLTQVELVPAPASFEFGAKEARNALAQVQILRDVLDGQQLDTLLSACKMRTFPGDTTLIRQGEAGTSMFVILEGGARVSVSVPGGESREVAVLTAGDIVGEMSLMTGAPRTATVTSLTALRVLEVTKQSIETLLSGNPGLLERFGRVLAARQLGLNEIAAVSQTKQAVERDVLARMRAFFSRQFH
jgi:small-conductance mechanosensitive channel/CRP-like cAMP-binding protein